MSYQVLARKWRPRIFREMVGQEHVLQALINALDHNRLHHAYLFTGTRGVGKTTIARILAKCLNCETGVSSEPCGKCGACTEIAEGRFVDLIEVDAASRTKVEDTRELLENVQYAPSRGRYKVYLIDEVHMLSTSSFNALLKTLEEPPPHVKFLLATTDPQKLPVTVLSRCLQFNLKNMNPERIVGHLAFVLEKELVPFEDAALWQLGRAADGSMRDALSLTDQAIAFGNGKVTEADVRAMLGTIDQQFVYAILQAMAKADGQAIFNAVNQLAEQAPDYQGALAELLSVLHRIAIAQALPDAIDNSFGDRDQVLDLAGQIPAEDIQLFYQTALLGRRDLPLAPDPRSGFDMVLLRMLAFKPQGVADLPKAALTAPAPGTPAAVTAAPTPATAVVTATAATAETSAAPAPNTVKAPEPAKPAAPAQAMAPAANSAAKATDANSSNINAAVANPAPAQPVSSAPSARAAVDSPPWDDEDQDASSLYADEDQGPEPVPSPQTPAASEPSPAPAAAVDRPIVETAMVEAPVAKAAPAAPTPSAVEVNKAPSPSPVAPANTPPVTAPSSAAPVQQNTIQPSHIQSSNVQLSSAQKVENEPADAAHSYHLVTLKPSDWLGLYLELKIGGVLQSTAANSQLVAVEGNCLRFVLDQANANLFDVGHQSRLADHLTAYFNEPVQVQISPGDLTAETPAATAVRLKAERAASALNSLQTDPLLQKLEREFQASLDINTVEPL
ncbi:DNA polymerase III subunit gamma/tau [Simiduia curdlanivorans]|uniref:DNA polymerase III subunit gamma/tau n=1 Tax=Simiduia curdlanivorans TaxID=1492769 RepID=A0ABV8V7K9_9GAMM|nr:DNA polymerase III subunit gamma/tau [Simiduia curdlanivorans]MDN3639034.1 DNA polymerase III subunit gamma/tau [Simiduia curdlanivorans]